MKRSAILALSLLIALLFAIPAAHAASSPLLLYLDGRDLKPATPPRIVKDTTMVPARTVSQALGAEVAWNAAGRYVTITHEQNVLVLTVGKNQAVVNDKPVQLDLAPFIEKGSILLPLRFIAENLGVIVRWDKPTRSINLWSSDANVSGSDPATAPAVPEIPGDAYPALDSLLFVNNQLVVKSSGKFTPSVVTLTGPDRVVVDIPGLTFGENVPAPAEGTMGEVAGIPADHPVVSNIRYAMLDPATSTIRIVADLKRSAAYQVVNSGDQNSLIVHLDASENLTPKGSAVLIYHTHARESFLSLLPGVTNPNLGYHPTKNVSLLGDRLAARLTAGGTEVFHAKDDYQSIYGSSYSLSKAYAYSEKTVKREMALHPQIKYVFDLHRDSSSRATTTINIGGVNYAKLYFVIGLENPDWKKNDAFAKKLQGLLTAKYPGISRGIYYKDHSAGNGWYNQNLSPRSALIEIGGVYNTLTESNRTVDILADAVNELRRSGY